jgi:peptide-methionine (S)-S-oxide reductase
MAFSQVMKFQNPLPLALAGLSTLLISACAVQSVDAAETAMPKKLGKSALSASNKPQTLIVGAGCFWCIESNFERLKGVKDVESGYAGGITKKATYSDVLTGRTGHAEVVKITFDPSKISGDDLLRIFFVAHDPTQLNRQGPDVGTQYRSVIFFETEDQKNRAERIRDEIVSEKLYKDKVVTTIEKLQNYNKAEEYHQNYFDKFEKASPEVQATMNPGYCSAVVSPKIRKFKEQFKHLFK